MSILGHSSLDGDIPVDGVIISVDGVLVGEGGVYWVVLGVDGGVSD